MTPLNAAEPQSQALRGLLLADFDAVAQVQSVWDDYVGLARDLHQTERQEILKRFSEAPQLKSETTTGPPRNPLIDVYGGVGGAGKTQLLSQIRGEVIASGAHFVLIDMTGLNRFYPTVCLNLIQSLMKRTPKGFAQLEHVLANLFQFVDGSRTEEEALRELRAAAVSSDGFEGLAAKISKAISLRFPDEPMALRQNHRKDVLRALILLGLLSADERWDAAFDWLQGGELEEDQARLLKLPRKVDTLDTIQAVTWIMSFRAPTVVAFDQLDVMVKQFETASRGGNNETAAAAEASVIDMAGGLARLWEQAYRSQILVSCLEQTWSVLKSRMIAPVMDRFRPEPIWLKEISSKEVAKRIIELRLQPAYHKVGFHAPYPSWPFADSFFEVGLTPRSLLQKCFAHREACVNAGRVTETGSVVKVTSLPPDALERLDRSYSDLFQRVSVQEFSGGAETSEKALGELLAHACKLLDLENPPPAHIVTKIGLDSSVSGKGLHTRLHLTLLKENDREEFFCFRALQHSNATAFQSRLRAAITESGVNLKLPFRRLVIVRNEPPPSGRVTGELVQTLKGHGGRILPLLHAELQSLAAIKSLRDQNDPHFASWLGNRKPLRRLSFIKEAFHDYFEIIVKMGDSPVPQQPGPTTKAVQPELHSQPKLEQVETPSIVLGKLLGPLEKRTANLPLSALTRHVLIRAGSGGGKTVLLKRLIESAALAGVPSIVLDPGNDLAFLGDAWPSAPSAWLDGDPQRAAVYHENVEVVVWTPGRTSGRPLGFSPLPDFAAVLDDPDDFESAVMMASGSLSEATGASKGGNTAQLKVGILTEGIRHFARGGGRTLPDLVAFMRNLPQEAQGGISKAQKLAENMADSLQAALLGSKTLMPSEGANLSDLLGIGGPKTRISVVSLAGLSETNGDRLAFVNQLAVILFTWIRKNPPEKSGQVRGLLVIDEARDFIPSLKSTPCKDSLMRVAAQARKYGFGLLLATQNPTDIDHKAAGQCATQFFGRAASPSVVDAMRRAIEERGGSATDLTQLGNGQFYFWSSESQKHPVRIQAPICLSYHPDGRTLTEAEILIRAKRGLKVPAG